MPAKKRKPTPESSQPRLSKVQRFMVKRIARSAIKTVPWNPRQIDKAAKKELEKQLRKKGLVETLVYNERSGNLVGGHQRLSIIDAIEGSPDYSLDVAVVDLDDADEKELNLALNNLSAQGVYDPSRLEALFESGVNFEAAGFSAMDLQMLFPESPRLESMFSAEHAPAAVKEDLAALQELSEQPRKKAETPEERIARMKREKREHREKAIEADDTENYAVVVTRDREERESLMERLGLSRDERYVPVHVLLAHLGNA